MTRMTVAGCMALAALGAAAVLDVGAATAEAAPNVSPFAGTYDRGGIAPTTVTISDGGRISGSVSEPYGLDGQLTISVSGRVSAGGSYSFTTLATISGASAGNSKTSSKSAGTMALDAAGNIDGTTGAGESFVWLRQ